MALLLVFGMIDLCAMALVTAAITVERLPPAESRSAIGAHESRVGRRRTPGAPWTSSSAVLIRLLRELNHVAIVKG
ncbi:MAG: DUF2182 domain-containing protein [Gemmatimonadota bacterium]|nr:DUF2182 domain-containing protein [Gemmatimonadota bacterium]